MCAKGSLSRLMRRHVRALRFGVPAYHSLYWNIREIGLARTWADPSPRDRTLEVIRHAIAVRGYG